MRWRNMLQCEARLLYRSKMSKTREARKSEKKSRKVLRDWVRLLGMPLQKMSQNGILLQRKACFHVWFWVVWTHNWPKNVNKCEFLKILHVSMGAILVQERYVRYFRAYPRCKNQWCFSVFVAQILLFLSSLFSPICSPCFTSMLSFTGFYTEDNPISGYKTRQNGGSFFYFTSLKEHSISHPHGIEGWLEY